MIYFLLILSLPEIIFCSNNLKQNNFNNYTQILSDCSNKNSIYNNFVARSPTIDTTDMDPSAVWYYKGIYNPDSNTIEGDICISVVGHEVIDGRYCYVLGRIDYDIIYPNSFLPVFTKDKKVYFYEDNQWHLLYDFSAVTGDTVTYHISKKSNEFFIGGNNNITPMAYQQNPFKLKIERIDTVSNGMGGQIRKFIVSPIGNNILHSYDYILDGIGFDWGFLGLNDISFTLDGSYPVGLTCYTDKTTEYRHPVFPYCKPSAVRDLSKNDYTLHPNPAIDNIKVSGIPSGAKINFYNLNGTMIMSRKTEPNEDINVSSFIPGMYIVEILDTSSSLLSIGKFIKI